MFSCIKSLCTQSMWEEVKSYLKEDIEKVGVEDTSNFVNAVIDERSYDKIKGFIDRARSHLSRCNLWRKMYKSQDTL